jgi:hypothetical protein
MGAKKTFRENSQPYHQEKDVYLIADTNKGQANDDKGAYAMNKTPS